jgi:short-subunit dehydrogenase
MQVSNKTFIVTGAGNGIGRELCLQLLQKGARVAAIDMSAERLAETKTLADNNQSKMSLHVLNITDKVEVEKLHELVIAAHGSIDGLINNAGIIQPFVKINDLKYSGIDRVMHVNFFGMLYMTKTFLPHLLKRPEAHIANVSSMGGFLPVPGQSVYGASKAAVKLFTEGLRSELLDTKVHVTIIFPGAINTHITENSGLAAPKVANDKAASFKMMSPQDAAATMIAGIEKNAYRILVGSDAKFMDVLSRLNPKFAAEFIYKKMRALLD